MNRGNRPPLPRNRGRGSTHGLPPKVDPREQIDGFGTSSSASAARHERFLGLNRFDDQKPPAETRRGRPDGSHLEQRDAAPCRSGCPSGPLDVARDPRKVLDAALRRLGQPHLGFRQLGVPDGLHQRRPRGPFESRRSRSTFRPAGRRTVPIHDPVPPPPGLDAGPTRPKRANSSGEPPAPFVDAPRARGAVADAPAPAAGGVEPGVARGLGFLARPVRPESKHSRSHSSRGGGKLSEGSRK